MIHDDEPFGQLLSRRKAIALLGASGAALLANAVNAAPACVVRPQQTEGPFFVDGDLHRSDIRGAKAGTPLALTLTISRLQKNDCAPLPEAQVDLWHCDAAGVYSGVHDGQFNTAGQTFLRGYQSTNERGEVRFVTIYPGWYPGRTVHLHFKVRARGSRQRAQEFTSQLYFDDAMTDIVHAARPYGGTARQRMRNQDDWIFRRGGDQLQLDVAKSGDMLAASFALAMQF